MGQVPVSNSSRWGLSNESMVLTRRSLVEDEVQCFFHLSCQLKFKLLEYR